jgi:hypothetical protein
MMCRWSLHEPPRCSSWGGQEPGQPFTPSPPPAIHEHQHTPLQITCVSPDTCHLWSLKVGYSDGDAGQRRRVLLSQQPRTMSLVAGLDMVSTMCEALQKPCTCFAARLQREVLQCVWTLRGHPLSSCAKLDRVHNQCLWPHLKLPGGRGRVWRLSRPWAA